MKKLITGILALLFSFSFTAPAQAEPSSYWTLGGSLLTFDDGFDTIEPVQIFGRLGYDLNANIGIGVEGGFSLIEDELAGVDFDVTTTFLYLKGSLPVGDGAKIYAMVGPTNVELTGTFGGFSASVDDDDTGFGFGYESKLNSHSFTIDYIMYNNNTGVDVSAINVGYVSYF